LLGELSAAAAHPVAYSDATLYTNSFGAGPLPGGAAAVIVKVRVKGLLVPLALVAVRVTGIVPAAVGVPEIKPVAALRDKPAGKVLPAATL
jgi:hypothetical protein